MEVISMEEKSFYELFNKVMTEMEGKFGQPEQVWIPENNAMELLGIKSKTTLQKLRDNDEIKFTQPRKKIILYNKPSLLEYLETHSNK